MRYGCNEDVIGPYAIQEGVGKAIEDELTLASPTLRPAQRRFDDAQNCVVELESEGLRGDLAALAIPALCFGQLLIGFRMEPDRLHPRRNKRARTSSQGIV